MKVFAPPAATPRTPVTREARVGPRRHAFPVGAITALAAAVYALYGLARYFSFRSGTYDLVIFDQAVRGYADFGLPVSIAKGVHNGFGYHFAVLGDHFSPILALLAPLYWVYDGPPTLLVAQGVLVALAIPSLWVFTRRALGVPAAYLVAVAYAISWPIQSAVSFDFHEVAFAPPLMALMFEREQAGRRVHAVLAALALLLVKEDMGLAVAGFGLYVLVKDLRRGRRRAWLVGASLAVGGLVMTWVATRVIIPTFGGDPNYYWHYNELGTTVSSAASNIVTHPLHALHVFTNPDVKVHTLLWLFAPLLFLPLLSPMVLPALPLLAERMLASDMPNWWTTGFQYNAFIVVPLFCAAVDGARRLRRRVPAGFGLGWAAAVCVIAVAVLPKFAFASLLHTSWYDGGPRTGAARAVIDRVPDGVLVEASNYLGPHLSGRDRVLLWDTTPRYAPWVVGDVEGRHFPFPSLEEQRERVRHLLANGYQVVFERDGYVVLHRENK